MAGGVQPALDDLAFAVHFDTGAGFHIVEFLGCEQVRCRDGGRRFAQALHPEPVAGQRLGVVGAHHGQHIAGGGLQTQGLRGVGRRCRAQDGTRRDGGIAARGRRCLGEPTRRTGRVEDALTAKQHRGHPERSRLTAGADQRGHLGGTAARVVVGEGDAVSFEHGSADRPLKDGHRGRKQGGPAQLPGFQRLGAAEEQGVGRSQFIPGVHASLLVAGAARKRAMIAASGLYHPGRFDAPRTIRPARRPANSCTSWGFFPEWPTS